MTLIAKPKAACYVRVSTLLGQSVENQITPICEYCSSRGLELPEERIYSDVGISGAKDRRPALDQLLRDARQGKYKFLIVAGLDRLGRNTKHLLTVLEELNALGVKFVSLREAIDLSTPQGQMTMTVLAAVSQLERELISQRIKEALAAKKLIAQKTGSNWRCGRKTKITTQVEQEILRLKKNGLSIRKTAKQLSVSKTAVLRVFQKDSDGTPTIEGQDVSLNQEMRVCK